PYGYISFETLALIGEEKAFNQLNFTVAENKDDFDHIKAMANLVEDRLAQSGVNVIFSLSFRPGEHPLQGFLDAMSSLLIALGVLAVLLGGFLIVNTLSAILAQQVRQIGIMKSIGARTPQLTAMYYVMVVLFGLISVAIAIPLGMLGAGTLSGIFGSFLNFDVARFAFNPTVALIQIIIAITIPLLAATWPIIKGTLTTVREAISDQGAGTGQFGTSGFDLFIVGLRRVVPMQRPTQISLRNTFRRKGRLALTLLTLSLASAIFISILSIRASLQLTLDEALGYFDYDVQIQFSRPYRTERLLNQARLNEGVSDAEIWGFSGARRVRPDGSESDNIIIYAPPADSGMIQPILLEGRWVRPEDTNAIVINNEVLRNEDDIGIGSTVNLKINGREKDWVVVGIARAAFPQPNIFVHYDYFSRVVNQVDLGQVIMIEGKDGYTQSEIGTSLEQQFRNSGFRVEQMQTVDEIRNILTLFFNVVIVFLLFMAVVLGIVGGLGLMGTMSINVIERLREIGVMRAVGASDSSVLRIVLVEGTIIGILSWFIGSAIALPVSRVLTDQVGFLLLSSAPSFIFSVSGTIAWLFIVIVLAIIASFLPARSASRVTVREVLSYE
ncbi:MAG: FtsX-like permease family protein, partial [Chloroflexota bacterium]